VLLAALSVSGYRLQAARPRSSNKSGGPAAVEQQRRQPDDLHPGVRARGLRAEPELALGTTTNRRRARCVRGEALREQR